MVQDRPGKNLWIASSDGDIDRVKTLIEEFEMTPNDPDENTYTPMHAAASYGHLELLDYLLSKGGLINITDEDQETPLFTVESIEVARYLIEHGADRHHRNQEGQTPAEFLEEDFPEVSAYLRSLDLTAPELNSPPLPEITTSLSRITSDPSPTTYTSQNVDPASEQLTSSLMDDVAMIMERSEQDGTDPDEALRQAVGRAVLEGLNAGQSADTQMEDTREEKRARMDKS